MPKQAALKVDISPNAVNTLGEISAMGGAQKPMNNKTTPATVRKTARISCKVSLCSGVKFLIDMIVDRF